MFRLDSVTYTYLAQFNSLFKFGLFEVCCRHEPFAVDMNQLIKNVTTYHLYFYGEDFFFFSKMFGSSRYFPSWHKYVWLWVPTKKYRVHTDVLFWYLFWSASKDVTKTISTTPFFFIIIFFYRKKIDSFSILNRSHLKSKIKVPSLLQNIQNLTR